MAWLEVVDPGVRQQQIRAVQVRADLLAARTERDRTGAYLRALAAQGDSVAEERRRVKARKLGGVVVDGRCRLQGDGRRRPVARPVRRWVVEHGGSLPEDSRFRNPETAILSCRQGPPRLLRHAPVDPFEQHGQLRGGQLDAPADPRPAGHPKIPDEKIGVLVDNLGTPDAPSEIQQAFVAHDGFQCGYCTPGQICSATAMLQEIASGWPSDASASLDGEITASGEEVRERMSGNLCRCGAYANIVAAIRDVAETGA